MKKLIVAAIAAGSAIGLGLVLAGSSQGALLNITVLDDEYDPKLANFNFLPFQTGGNVSWDWDQLNGGTTDEHTVTSKKGLFNSGDPQGEGVFDLMASAGKYPYFCEVHGNDMKAKMTITPAGDEPNEAQGTVKVYWANADTTTGKRFDVRYRVEGGKWKYWLKNTKKKNGTFGKNDKPIDAGIGFTEYSISVRSRKGSPSKHKWSGFSPPLEITE